MVTPSTPNEPTKTTPIGTSLWKFVKTTEASAGRANDRKRQQKTNQAPQTRRELLRNSFADAMNHLMTSRVLTGMAIEWQLLRAAEAIRSADLQVVLDDLSADDECSEIAYSALRVVLADTESVSEVADCLECHSDLAAIKDRFGIVRLAGLKALLDREQAACEKEGNQAGCDSVRAELAKFSESKATAESAFVAPSKRSMEQKTKRLVPDIDERRKKGATLDEAISEIRSTSDEWENVDPSSIRSIYYRARKKLKNA
jgi:hypothetical protein